VRLGVEAALVRGELVPGDVEVEDGRIEAVGLASTTRGKVAIPGFVDLQVNGYGGVDFLSASQEDYARAGEALLVAGVTAYQPTFITSTQAATVEALHAMPTSASGPRIIGAHLEGPFLSPEHPGAHPLEHLRTPDLELLDRLLIAGNVTQMTLAPELPGADTLIERLRERGIAIAAGHTNATAAEAEHAFELGVGAITHVFNAMRPFRSRDPGIAGVALTRPDVLITIVVDGHHLAAETVRLVWGCAAGRVALISDAIAAAGSVIDGATFQLGDVAVEIGDGAPPMREDGTLAGTVLTMIDAVRNLHALGASFEEAVGAATEVPARLLGRSDIGVLEPGAPADTVVLDDRLEIQSVLCSGRCDVVARN
jgi:N-acetylglucosamine-6-phosphate deacetylase